MTQSQTITELAKALAVAQGKIRGAAKDSANPFFKSTYADLASVWDACREPLSTCGLAVVQCPSTDGAKVTVTTMLLHGSGEWISTDLVVMAKEATPQAVGSAITYARRYALQSVVGIAPEDDDGEAAEGRTAPRKGQWHPSSSAAPHPEDENQAAERDERTAKGNAKALAAAAAAAAEDRRALMANIVAGVKDLGMDAAAGAALVLQVVGKQKRLVECSEHELVRISAALDARAGLASDGVPHS